MKAVIYARFSCARQREASITDQLRVCHEYCEQMGYEVVREYHDNAISGRTDDRPAFQEMIANAGESDFVVVYMLDRFSRDRYDSVVYKKKLKDRGVKVISATEPMPEDDAAILIESVYEAMAAIESAHIAKRIKRGLDGNAMNCQFNGAHTYGYTVDGDGHYIINEEEAHIVREIFERRIACETVSSIAKDLESRKIRDKMSYGFVYNIIKNEKYTGVYIWGDYRIEGGMPQIVSREVFEAAQVAKSHKQPKTESWREYPLSGKTICGKCGYTLHGASARGNGGRYDYYKCGNCKGIRTRADKLEELIVDALRDMLSDEAEARRIADIISSRGINSAAAKAAQKRLNEAERGIDNLIKAIANGVTSDRIQGRIDELEETARAARVELKRYECMSLDKELLVRFLRVGATLTDEKLLKAFVYQVLLLDDEIIVVLNYNKEDEPARISLPVRVEIDWWTVCKSRRTEITLYRGHILIKLKCA